MGETWSSELFWKYNREDILIKLYAERGKSQGWVSGACMRWNRVLMKKGISGGGDELRRKMMKEHPEAAA